MFSNPFTVRSFCKLNHISVSFIPNSMKVICKKLIPFQESHVFFERYRCFGPLDQTFNITQRFLLRQPEFSDYLSISCDNDKDSITDMVDIILLYFTTLQYVILCSKNFNTENIVKIVFSLPCRFSSLKMLKLVSVNTELYEKYFTLTSHGIFHYFWSAHLSKSFSQLIASVFTFLNELLIIFSQYFFSLDLQVWGYPTLLMS